MIFQQLLVRLLLLLLLLLLRGDHIVVQGRICRLIGHYPAGGLGTPIEAARVCHLRHAGMSHPQVVVGVCE